MEAYLQSAINECQSAISRADTLEGLHAHNILTNLRARAGDAYQKIESAKNNGQNVSMSQNALDNLNDMILVLESACKSVLGDYYTKLNSM